MKRPIVVAVAISLGGGVAVAGCNLVVDAGGYKVGLGGADSGTGSDTSTGSDTGTSADTSMVDSGSPSEGGPVSCGQGLPNTAEFDQLVESCVLAVSCDPNFYIGVTLSSCITNNYLQSLAAFSCLTGIHSCSDYFQCEHERYATIADCPNSAASQTCSGNLSVSCTGQGLGSVIDCAGLGAQCQLVEGEPNCVVIPSCVEAEGGAVEQCSASNQVYECVDGVGIGQVCGAGSTCGNGAAGVGCYFDEPPCQTPNSAQCVGAKQEDCTVANQLLTFDCSVTGSSCGVIPAEGDSGAETYCVAPGCTLSSIDSCTESCGADGITLNACIGGAPYPIDCTKYGTFTSCAQSPDAGAGVFTYCQ
jgi:hypothetical protein